MRLTDGQARTARHCERVALFAHHHVTDPRRRAWRIPPPATYEMADWMDTAPPARFPRGAIRDTTFYGRHLAQLNLRRALSPCA